MSGPESEPPVADNKRPKRWLKRSIALAILAIILYLPALEFYIRATSYPLDGNLATLWKQRVGMYDVHYPTEPLFPVEIPGSSTKQYCYIDNSGNIVITGPFTEISQFSEGFAAVAIIKNSEELWGYIDNTGAFKIQPIFVSRPGSFRDGLAKISTGRDLNRRYGFIDKTGRWVIKPRFRSITEFIGGIAQIPVLPPSHLPLAFLKGEGGPLTRCRFIDTNGNRLRAIDLRDFDVNLAPPVPVGVESSSGSIRTEYHNGDGVNVFGRDYENGYLFYNGLAPAKENGVWGYIDRAGVFVIQPQFIAANMFKNGYAGVARVGSTGYGMIDQQAKSVIPDKHRFVADFRDGLIPVQTKQGTIVFINLNSEQIWPPVSNTNAP